mgnify:CR=1 FL=1
MELFILGFLLAAIRSASILLLASLGEVVAERSGVINIGLEGMMLAGALGGFLGSYYGGSPWIGVLVAIGVGALFGLIHAFMSVTLGVDQIVTGLALNLASLGATGFILKLTFGRVTVPPQAASFPFIKVPLLSKLPYLGPLLFSHTPLIYLALILVPLLWFVLFKTSAGLKLRAVGEHPLTADARGVNVFLVRYIGTIFGGAMAGLAGVQLSLGELSVFTENMTAGRGFIALASVILGKWNPFGVLGATLLFGAADVAQLRLQAIGLNVPQYFLLMVPYVITILVLAGAVGRANPPMALGVPYMKGAKV